jgi:hypothetical protein
MLTIILFFLFNEFTEILTIKSAGIKTPISNSLLSKRYQNPFLIPQNQIKNDQKHENSMFSIPKLRQTFFHYLLSRQIKLRNFKHKVNKDF